MRIIDTTRATKTNCYNNRPKGDAGKIAACVIHHSAGTNSLAWLSGDHGVSTHKLINKNGDIFKIVPESKRAWHAGESDWGGRQDWNDFSLGYELENLGDGHDPYTDAQYESLAQTLAYDASVYHIPDDWIRDHKEIATPRGRKDDPDPSFDHARLWKRMGEIRSAWPFAPVAMWCCARSA